MRQKQPSRTSLTRQAKMCVFDPRAAGPMKVIAENGNILYYEDRAVESIMMAREQWVGDRERVEELRKAVGLLLLSLEIRDGQLIKDRAPGDGNSGSNRNKA